MPEFILDTSGQVPIHGRRTVPNPAEFIAWEHLDAFTQGYITALFFTDAHPDTDLFEEWKGFLHLHRHPGCINPPGFAELAPEALARILDDCAKFQCGQLDNFGRMELDDRVPGSLYGHAGHDFWLTRNGHGAGFWDGDWPEPYATELDNAAKSFGQVDVYLGDDGKVHLS